jgi:thiol-disulfide isomerase/thioredoxin
MSRSIGRRRLRHPKKTRKVLHKRQTAVGRIFSPIDVRNKNQIPEMLKRILAGNITIVLVYADWCGHCTDFKPHFDAASKSPNRTAQVVSVKDSMVDEMNSAINSMNSQAKPLDVKGYPSLILVDNKGNKISEVNAVKDTETMTKLVDSAGKLEAQSKSARRNSVVPSNSVAPSAINNVNELVNSNGNKSRKNSTKPLSNQKFLSLPPVIRVNTQSAEQAVGSIVSPPQFNDDLTGDHVNTSTGSIKGGSLYGALAQSAYKLAPAGILLGLAATRFCTRKGRRNRRSRRHR